MNDSKSKTKRRTRKGRGGGALVVRLRRLTTEHLPGEVYEERESPFDRQEEHDAREIGVCVPLIEDDSDDDDEYLRKEKKDGEKPISHLSPIMRGRDQRSSVDPCQPGDVGEAEEKDDISAERVHGSSRTVEW